MCALQVSVGERVFGFCSRFSSSQVQHPQLDPQQDRQPHQSQVLCDA